MEISQLRSLRWVGVVAPVAFLTLLTYAAIFHFPNILSSRATFGLVVGISAVGAFLFSNFIFSQIEKREQEILRHSRELATLHAISEVVSSSLKLEDILTRTLEKVLDVTGTEAAEIFLLDKEARAINLAVHRGAFPEAFREVTRFALDEGIPGRVAATAQAELHHQLATEPAFIRLAVKDLGFQSYACVPLLAKDQVMGVLDVADRRKMLTSDDLNLLTSIGNQLGVAIENAQLYERVQQSADYLDALIETSGDAMITVGLDNRIMSWNRGAEEIYGWSREEAVGQAPPMVPPEEMQATHALLKKLLEGVTIRNLEVVRQRKNGERLDAIVTVSQLRDVSSQIVGFLGISKDISELKRLQRELLSQRQNLAILQERERIGMDLHDGVIQSLYSVGLRLESCLPRVITTPDEVIQRLEQITDDVTDIIKQIRDYVFDLRPRHLHGRDLIQGIIELVQESKINTLMPVEVVADDMAKAASGRLSELQATNLFLIAREALANILKHARASQATIRLSAGDGCLRLAVKDGGIGFDPHVPRSSAQNGLRNITERAKLLGAQLNITSQAGRGTEIEIKIPLEDKS